MSKRFIGGKSTRLEVEELMKLDVQRGDSIDYSKIEEMLGISRNEERFRTITGVWRNRLFREYGMDIIVDGGVFVVLTAQKAVSVGIKRLEKVGRAAGKTVKRIDAIDAHNLSQDEQHKCSLLRRYSRAVLESAQDAVKQVALPKPISGSTLRLTTRN